MKIRIPERNKKAGVCYALSEDGVELPVIDITHPAFAFQMDEATLVGYLERFYREEERQKRLPVFLKRVGGSYRTTTDEAGKFQIASVASCDYVLNVSTVGYRLIKKPFHLDPGKPRISRLPSAPIPSARRIR